MSEEINESAESAPVLKKVEKVPEPKVKVELVKNHSFIHEGVVYKQGAAVEVDKATAKLLLSVQDSSGFYFKRV